MKFKRTLAFLSILPILAGCDLFTPPYLLSLNSQQSVSSSRSVNSSTKSSSKPKSSSSSRNVSAFGELRELLSTLSEQSTLQFKAEDMVYETELSLSAYDYRNFEFIDTLTYRSTQTMQQTDGYFMDNFFGKSLGDEYLEFNVGHVEGTENLTYSTSSQTSSTTSHRIMSGYFTYLVFDGKRTVLPSSQFSSWMASCVSPSGAMKESFICKDIVNEIKNTGLMTLQYGFNVYEAFSSLTWFDFFKNCSNLSPETFSHFATTKYECVEISLNDTHLNHLNKMLNLY